MLVPVALADTPLRVAERGLYRPLWSERILAEARGHRGNSSRDRRGQALADMDAAFDDALITGWEGPEAVHRRFLLDQLDLSPPTVLQVLREQAAATRRPPLTRQDLALLLSRAGVPGFADEIQRLMSAPLDNGTDRRYLHATYRRSHRP